MTTEIKQECLCSLSLVEECPAHPFRERRARKPKVSRQALRGGECPACVFIKEANHEQGRHPLYVGDVTTALEIGPVFCLIPELSERPLIVRGAVKRKSVYRVEVLEGEFVGVKDIWMNAPEHKSKRAA